MSHPATGSKVRGVICGLLFFSGGLLFSAPPIDESKLPLAATDQIDFTRDIKPILETSCLRCHGPEKTKSKFRLDNREAALKGGEQGVDILPGDSAKSPLIHYAAQLVADMEMPPVGKGEPLTAQQIGLLRAWINQGVVWDATPTNNFSFSISPTFGGTSVNGDERKFREHYWQKEGFNGGAEHFEWFEQRGPNTKVLLAGHALLDDYKIVGSVDRNELGFIHTGWEQYRKYYDDTGGYRPTPPATPPALSLGRDLHLDIGKAWVDFGLTLPSWPRMVLGYEYDYKQGEESITSWNSDLQRIDPHNIAPASKDLHERVHVIKFDLDAEVRGVTIEDRFRGEFYQLDTHTTNAAARGPVFQDVSQSNHYFQGANSIRLEKKFKDWLLGSAGYFYSQLNADAAFMDTATYLRTPHLATVPEITLDRESHVFNANGLVGPFAGLTFSTGVQSEWTREHGFGSGSLHRIPFTFQVPVNLNTNAAILISDHDENSVSENFALRYGKIPFTLLFAEARLRQQSIGQSDSDIQPSGSYLDNVDFTSQLNDLRCGFTTSPWKAVSLSTHYRRYEENSDYRNNRAPQPVGSYPGFIRGRELQKDEVEAKLAWRPLRWFKTTLAYQFLTTDSWTDTNPAFDALTNYSPGGYILAGQQDARIYSLSTTLTPCQRLYLDTTFSYQTSTTVTANNDVPTVVPYNGQVYSVLASGTYVLNQTTDLFASYSFSKADYGQDNFAGVPVGIEYQQHAVQVGLARRIGKNVTAQLRYGFYNYDEPSSGGANNYTAHSVFGMVSFKLP